jgi:hypothetical protein
VRNRLRSRELLFRVRLWRVERGVVLELGVVDHLSDEAAQGFDSALQRAAGNLINISERTIMKVLHVRCGSLC